MTKEKYQKICKDIVDSINKDLEIGNFAGDIGNAIGYALGKHICKNQKMTKKGILTYNDFKRGFKHGISLHDGTH